MNLYHWLISKLKRSKTSKLPKDCFVRGCVFEKNEEGQETIYCGVQKPGIVIKKRGRKVWVERDGCVMEYDRSKVKFAPDSPLEGDS